MKTRCGPINILASSCYSNNNSRVTGIRIYLLALWMKERDPSELLGDVTKGNRFYCKTLWNFKINLSIAGGYSSTNRSGCSNFRAKG